jgi:hypothetical protein
MKETTLRFLMSDGAEAYTFRPALTPQQYAELHVLVEHAHDTEELLESLRAFCLRWNLELVVNPA